MLKKYVHTSNNFVFIQADMTSYRACPVVAGEQREYILVPGRLRQLHVQRSNGPMLIWPESQPSAVLLGFPTDGVISFFGFLVITGATCQILIG